MESEKEKRESKDQTDKSTQPGTAYTNISIAPWYLQHLKDQKSTRQNQLILNKEIPKGPEPTKPKSQDERRILQYQQFFGSVTIPEYYNVKTAPYSPFMMRNPIWKVFQEKASLNFLDELGDGLGDGLREKDSFQYQLYSSGIEIIRSQNDVIRQSQERGRVVLYKSHTILCTHHLYISGFKLILETIFDNKNIPKFNEKHFVSKGSFGKCYRIKNKDGKQECLKVIKFDDKYPKYFDIQSTIREVGICKLLGVYQIGPKLKSCSGFDVLVYEDAMCYTMEKCQSLEQKIGEFKGKDMEELIQKIELDLKEALLKMHSLKLVHRDIKQGNILFSGESNKFIFCDFGLTHSVQQTYTEKTYVRELGGTKKYMMEQMWDLWERNRDKKRIDQEDRFVNLYYNDVVCLQRTIQFIRQDFLNYQKMHSNSEGCQIASAHQFLTLEDNFGDLTHKRLLNIYKYIFGPSINTQLFYQQFMLRECQDDKRTEEKKHYQQFLKHFDHRYYEQQLTKLESITSYAGTIHDREIILQGRYFVFKMLRYQKSPLLVRLKGFKYMSGCNQQQLEQLRIILKKIFSEKNLSSAHKTFLEIFQIIFDRKYQIESWHMFKKQATLLKQSIRFHQKFIKSFSNDSDDSDDPDIVCLSQTLMYFLVDLVHPENMNALSMKLLKREKIDLLSQIVKVVEIHMNLLKSRNIHERLETLMVYCTVIKKLLPLHHTNQKQLWKLMNSAGILLQNLCRSDPKTFDTPYHSIIFFYQVILQRSYQKGNEELFIINQFLLFRLFEHFGKSNYYISQISQNIAEYYHSKKDYKNAIEMKQIAYVQTFEQIGEVERMNLSGIRLRYSSKGQLSEWMEQIQDCVTRRNKKQFASLAVSLIYELNEPYRVKEYPSKQQQEIGLARQICIQSHPIFFPFEIKPFYHTIQKYKQISQTSYKRYQVIVSYQVVMSELWKILDSLLENLNRIKILLEPQGDDLKEFKERVRNCDFGRKIKNWVKSTELMRLGLAVAMKIHHNFFQIVEIGPIIKALECEYQFVLNVSWYPELHRLVEKSVEEMKGKYLRWKQVLKENLKGESESNFQVEL